MNTDTRRFFIEHGYAVLRGAFAGDRLQELREHGHSLRQRAEREFPEGLRHVVREGKSAETTWGMNEITRQDWFDPVLVNAIAAPALLGALHEILDEPRAWGQKILWAPRGVDYNLHWHRDIPHRYDALMPFKPPRNDHVQFNGALESDDSFIVVPGSHRRPILPEEIEALRQSQTAELPGQLQVRLEPGDVVMMDAHALHRGQAKAGAPRLSLHFSFQAHWVPLLPWGNPGDFSWIQSDAFIGQLDECIRPLYRRLSSAVRLAAGTEHMQWLEDAARANGFTGDLVDPWPPRQGD